MANIQRLTDALNSYTGEPDSLTAFAKVAEEELGENWTSTIYDVITPSDEIQKEKLDHVYHYYGATLAWGEVQEYLEQSELLDLTALSDRIPTLEYWLNFFGDQGLQIINELQEKMRQQLLMQEVIKVDESRKMENNHVIQTVGTDQTELLSETVSVDEAEPETSLRVENPKISENQMNRDDERHISNESEIFEEPIKTAVSDDLEVSGVSPDSSVSESEILLEPTMEPDSNQGSVVQSDSHVHQSEEDSLPAQMPVIPSVNLMQDTHVYADNSNTDIGYVEEDSYENNSQQYDTNGYPIDGQQYDANGYPIDGQQYDANGYPIDGQQYDANGYPIDGQQYDANGYPIDGQQYDANGYPIDGQQYDANGYPIDSQQYDMNGYPIVSDVPNEIQYNTTPTDTLSSTTGMPMFPVSGNVPMPGDEHVRPTAKFQPEKPETNEQFMARKAFKQLDFVNIVHSWMDARCIALGNIEIYTYKHYGFLIDAMEQAQKDIKEVLSSPAYYPAIESARPNGLQTLQNSLVALEKDLEIAYDNAPGETTALIKENMNSDEARRLLGMIDTSNKKEYLGPAPDGFEMLDDPFDDTNKI